MSEKSAAGDFFPVKETMPFYEYECENCKFYTELLQKVSDAPLKKCPSCGKSTMKKLVSAPVFRLKGGGWYETDFKGDKENKRNLAVDKEPDTASDSKPAKGGSADTKALDSKSTTEAKPAESKAADSSASSGSSGGESRGSSSGSGSRKAGASRSASAAGSKSRAKPAAKAKAKSAKRR
jgi:putative FmdB family regulatory protein